MGNVGCTVRKEQEILDPPPDYEPDKHHVTLVLDIGGRIVGGKYINDGNESTVYKYDYVLVSFLSPGAIRNHAHRLHPGVEFNIYQKLKNGGIEALRSDVDFRMACEGLGAERELHLYMVKREDDDSVDIVEESDRDDSINLSEFSDSDEDYEYAMRESDDDSTDVDENVFDEHAEMVGKEGASSMRNKGKEKHISREGDAEVVGDEQDEHSSEDVDDDVVEDREDIDTARDSDAERDPPIHPIFNNEKLYEPNLVLGMIFSTKTELKQAIQSYAIINQRSVKFVKNDLQRLVAKCESSYCPWVLRGRKVRNDACFQISELYEKHTCKPSYNVRNLSSRWLAHKMIDKFVNDPKRDVDAFRKESMDHLKVHISDAQALRAKYIARKLVDGTPNHHFDLLWDFVEEVKRSNPGSTVVVECDGSDSRRRFDRIYICLEALKSGFVRGCRPLICVDGCWLKNNMNGILLTACGIDANNSYLPIAWAVVHSETAETWAWFFRLLKADLKIEDTNHYTIMSDKQKGLIQAEIEEFPGAEYRYCARHLLVNFQNSGFRGTSFKKIFWKAARSSTSNQFERCMEELEAIDPKAAQWLREKPANQWCRAFFREFPRCDVLTNNACENFNSNILKCREMPMLTMLIELHVYMMKRIQKIREKTSKSKRWNEVLCPRIQKIIDFHEMNMFQYIPTKADSHNFQIDGPFGQRFAVNLREGRCGCGKWQLSGLPCIHALSAINFQRFDVEPYIHKCYEVATFKKIYAEPVMPMNGKNEWPKSTMLPMLPPIYQRKRPGRPSTKRRLEQGESSGKSSHRRPTSSDIIGGRKLRKQYPPVSCQKCGQLGHNKRTCKGTISANSGGNAVDVENTVQEGCGSKATTEHDRDATLDMEYNEVFPLVPDADIIPNTTNEVPLLEWMKQTNPSTESSQPSQSSVNMVIPAPFVSSAHGDPSRKMTRPLPTILQGGKKFLTLSNLVRDGKEKSRNTS